MGAAGKRALISPLGQREGQCHQNALWYARYDPGDAKRPLSRYA